MKSHHLVNSMKMLGTLQYSIHSMDPLKGKIKPRKLKNRPAQIRIYNYIILCLYNDMIIYVYIYNLGVWTRPIWYPESWETAKMPFCVLGNSWSLIIMNQRPSSHLKPPTAGDSNIGANIQNMDVVTPKHIQTLSGSIWEWCEHVSS